VGGCAHELANLGELAARLAKADLVTGMVGEFPELQGVIGGYLAEAQGEPKAIADAIRDHYKPAGQGDEVPTAPVTMAVSLADKLDTLAVFFAIQERPTGSKDPYALRRAVLGAVSIWLVSALRIPLRTVLRKALEIASQQPLIGDHLRALGSTALQMGGKGDDPLVFAIEQEKLILLLFFIDRLKVQQRDAGVRHDLIDAVFALGGEDDLVRLLARVKALQAFVETADGNNLLVAYKRAANILKKEKWEGTPASGGGDVAPQEKALMAALDKAEPKASAAIEKEDFTGAMSALASLRKPIDDFFDHVTVNDPDAAKRERRLNLLMRFRDAVNRVADFSRIEG
jgi:glycyl-tRNA synthetase beta chain